MLIWLRHFWNKIKFLFQFCFLQSNAGKLIIIGIVVIISLFCTCNNANQTNAFLNDTVIVPDSIIDTEIQIDTILIDSTYASKIGIKLWPEGDYNQLKKQIKVKRQEFYNSYLKADDNLKEKILQEAGNYLFDNLLNKIIPFWYNTPWCLSGYSNIPQDGTVGCSYFVSNTLLACGFNLNRYRLAQTDPIAGSRSLTFSDSVVNYIRNDSIEKVASNILKNHTEGLYIVGLDMHVGYLLIYKSKLYFIHSAYYPPNVVCMERFEKATGILGSSNYYITPITSNRKLLEKWILNEFIYIQKPLYMPVDETRWDKQ